MLNSGIYSNNGQYRKVETTQFVNTGRRSALSGYEAKLQADFSRAQEQLRSKQYVIIFGACIGLFALAWLTATKPM